MKLTKAEKKRQKKFEKEEKKRLDLMDDFYNNVYLVDEKGKATKIKKVGK